jgi:hypothetical protein
MFKQLRRKLTAGINGCSKEHAWLGLGGSFELDTLDNICISLPYNV